MRKPPSKTAPRQVTPKSRAAWRAWLEKNHDRRSEVWLVFYKRGTAKPTLTYDDAVEEALCFGWIDGVRRRLDAQRYMHRFSPRKEDSNWSASNKARVARLVRAGLMTAAGRRLIAAAKNSGRWAASAKRPSPSPDAGFEFAARLKRNARANAFFQTLPPSERSRYESWIAIAQRPETRARRIAEAMKLLIAERRLGLR
jgi:uncharacterized protein YdeI (YjbR/CyaY-like superfamily)